MRKRFGMRKREKSKLAAKLGQLGKGIKKTMTLEAIEQRRAAALSRWHKPRSRNQRKPKPLRNVALLVLALTAIGSAYLIHRGESDLWASPATLKASSYDLADARPTIEIQP